MQVKHKLHSFLWKELCHQMKEKTFPIGDIAHGCV